MKPQMYLESLQTNLSERCHKLKCHLSHVNAVLFLEKTNLVNSLIRKDLSECK